MDLNKTVTAIFNRAPNAKIGATGYLSLNEAYKAAAAGDTIQMLATELTESLVLNRGIGIVLKGGYKADYSGPSGNPTTLKGIVTIGLGSLSVEGLVIK